MFFLAEMVAIIIMPCFWRVSLAKEEVAAELLLLQPSPTPKAVLNLIIVSCVPGTLDL